MTGQVKEEILTRFIELGARVRDGEICIEPALLRQREFAAAARTYCYLDVAQQWQSLDLPAASLAYTWCQLPFVYVLNDAAEPGLEIEFDDGNTSHLPDGKLPRDLSDHVFERTGRIRKVTVTLRAEQLFGE